MWRRSADFLILISISVLFIPFFGLRSTIDPVLMPRFLVWSLMSLVLFVSVAIQICKKTNSLDLSILRRILFPAFLGYFLFSAISLFKTPNITEGIYEVLKVYVSVVYLFVATIILTFVFIVS